MGRALQIVEDESDEECPTPRRSGFVQSGAQSGGQSGGVATLLSPADYVLRSLRLHQVLAEMVAEQIILPEEARTLRAIADSCIALDDVADAAPYARILLAFGACLTDYGLSEQAEPPLFESLAIADALPSMGLGAAVRRALGRALFMRRDPSCVTILEEALEMFLVLGDREGAVDVATLLRRANAEVAGLGAALRVPR